MTDTERIQQLEAILGAQFLGKTADELHAALVPANELPGGKYPYVLSDYQLRVAFADALAQIESLKVKVAALETASPSPIDAPVKAAVIAALDSEGVYVRGGKLGLGMAPVQDTDARLTIEGGQILGHTAGNFQNPVDHENILDICNSDGGIRFVQYGRFFNGQVIRNTTNRKMSIFAIFDSMGDTCISDDVSAPGQCFYLLKDNVSKTVTLATYKPGWTVKIKESTVYGGIDKERL